MFCDFYTLWIFICFAHLPSFASTQNRYSRLLEEFNRLVSDITYQKTEMPPRNDEGPLEIELRLGLFGVGHVSEIEQTFNVDAALEISWLDPRLDLQKHLDNTLDQTASLSLNQQFLKEIWKPQIWMSNSIESKIPNNPDLNLLGGDTFFTLAVGGKVTVTRLLATVFKCAMDLTQYPFDKHVCNIEISSTEFNTTVVQLKWGYPSVIIDTPSQKFIDLKFKLTNVQNETSVRPMSPETDNYTEALVRFTFTRKTGYHIYQTFIPSLTLVIVSWMIFWVKMTDAEKMSFEIIILLALITLSTVAQSHLPEVSYLKFMDMWLMNCGCFCCAALLQIPFTSKLVQHLQGLVGRPVANETCEELRNMHNTLKELLVELARQNRGTVKNTKSKTTQDDRQEKNGNVRVKIQKKKLKCWTPEETVIMLCRVLFPVSFVVSVIVLFRINF